MKQKFILVNKGANINFVANILLKSLSKPNILEKNHSNVSFVVKLFDINQFFLSEIIIFFCKKVHKFSNQFIIPLFNVYATLTYSVKGTVKRASLQTFILGLYSLELADPDEKLALDCKKSSLLDF